MIGSKMIASKRGAVPRIAGASAGAAMLAALVASRCAALVVPFVAASIAAFVPTSALAAPRTGAASSLLAVAEVRTRVEGLLPSLEETGVTRERLDSLVVARLREAGVPVARAAENARESLLAVQATYLINSGWHIVSLSLYFARSAALEADASTIVQATVWSRGTVVVARKKKIRDEVVRSLEQAIDEFAQEYRAANPR